VRGGRSSEVSLDVVAERAIGAVQKIVLRAEAERASGLAQRSASKLDAAANDFARALKSLGEGPQAQALRYQIAEARIQAWRLGPNGRRARAADVAATDLLAFPATPAGRDSAAAWRNQVRR